MKRLFALALSVMMVVTLTPMMSFAVGRIGFRDVDTIAWYAPAVEYVASSGIMSGVGSNRFEPESNVTRGMIVQMLYNLEGRPVGAADSGFSDVAPGAWYSSAVNWAASKDIVGGYGNGRFGPEDSVTREQTAVMLRKYGKYKNYNTFYKSVLEMWSLRNYPDSDDISSWAFDSMDWALSKKILSGFDDGSIRPNETATRAQIAQIFRNYVENIVKKGVIKTKNEDGSWNSVHYIVKTEDKSKPRCHYRYGYVQITSQDYPYTSKINSELEAEKNRFFLRNDENVMDKYLENLNKDDSYYNFIEFWVKNKDVYSDHGILSMSGNGEEAYGITGSEWSWHPHTFDLNTGKELTFPEILGMNESEAMNTFLNIIEDYSPGILEGDNGLYLYGDPHKVDPDKIKYYVDGSGEIMILLNTFEFTARFGDKVDTGYNIAMLR